MHNTVRVSFAEGARAPRDLEWNSAVCGIARFGRYLSVPTCRRVVELAAQFESQPGRMQDGDDHLRSNRVRWIPPRAQTQWVFDFAANLLTEANRRFGFDLEGFVEPLQVIDYEVGDHIGWHLDCTRKQTSTRKLVATILLSDASSFAGGELEFAATHERPPRQEIGDALVFPAFLAHRVLPVTRGSRRTLVAWAHGSPFR